MDERGLTLGVKHLGLTIPHYIMWLGGKRWREPGSGLCSECGERRERVYIRGDGSPYCSDCIMFDIAEASPPDDMVRDQRHPGASPREVRYDLISSTIADGADLRTYDKAFG